MKKYLIILLIYPFAVHCAEEVAREQNELNKRLLKLVKSGSAHEVEELIIQGASVDALTDKGKSALFLSAYHNNMPVCRLLLQKKAAVNLQVQLGSFAGCTALMAAAHTNNCELIGLLIAHGARGELVNSLSNTALTIASHGGHYDACKTLLESAGIDLDKNSANEKGETALLGALLRDYLAIGKLLILHGVDLQAPTALPPLFLAARIGRFAWIPLLIEAGALVNFGNDKGITCLMMCAQKGAYESCVYLLQHGARVTMLNDIGYDAAAYAANSGHDGILELLVQHKASLDRVYLYGRSLLHLAIFGQQAHVVRMLLSWNPDPNYQDLYGRTPLHEAVACGDTAVCALLLEAKAHPDVCDNDNETPFSFAIKTDNPALCMQLLQGAKEQGRTIRGRSPLILAILAESPEACKLFVKGTRGIFTTMRYTYQKTYYQDQPFTKAVYQGNVAVCHALIASCMYLPTIPSPRSFLGKAWDRFTQVRDPHKIITMLFWCAKQRGMSRELLGEIIKNSDELQDFLLMVLIPKISAHKHFDSFLVPLIAPAIARCTIEQLKIRIDRHRRVLNRCTSKPVLDLLDCDTLAATFNDDLIQNIATTLYESLSRDV